jgi:flagellar protein FliS
MYETTGIRTYRESNANSLGPEKLVVALYETILQESEGARQHLAANDRVEMLKGIRRVTDIISELRSALDHDLGGEIAANLDTLYEFMLHECLQLIADRDPRHLDHLRRVIAPLLHAWRQIPPGTADRARRELLGQAEPAPAGPDPASRQAHPQTAPAPPRSRPRETGEADEASHVGSICISA